MQNFHRKIDSLSQKCNYSKKKNLGFAFLPYATWNEAVTLLQTQMFNWLGTLL